MVVMVNIVVIVRGLRRTLPIFATDDRRAVRAEQAIHARRAGLGFGEPFQEGFDQ